MALHKRVERIPKKEYSKLPLLYNARQSNKKEQEMKATVIILALINLYICIYQYIFDVFTPVTYVSSTFALVILIWYIVKESKKI